ncbi:xanthine dehydrogenase family protein molybdopterin-binding subunit [SAR202 cluster bacterium AD-804-J14_MRT_500m]|nr:xanthine dehydrogenase family protein molybdopterin-binding subunit [SAR202 cluster bacterium AD-804-J14_MRT_500m]
MSNYESNQILATKDYQVIGKRPIRPDGFDKVTGRARFSADIQMPGLCFGKILRSPHAHAKILSIDLSKAEALPGVVAVVSSLDLPEVSANITDLEEGAIVNYGFYSRNVLAREKALYVGHAVAAVAATSLSIAQKALSLIDVTYEVLPPVLNAEQAMRENAPVLHERLLTMATPLFKVGGYGDKNKTTGTNIANHFEFTLGNINQGFEEADVVVEREFHTVPVHQGYIETHAATALWGPDDYLTVWCSSQGHFAVRDHTAAILGIPVSRLKVVPMEIGGGFGGKGQGGVYLEPVVAILSKKSGHPVKITMDRDEVFLGTGPTSGTHIRVKMGATANGKLTAAEASLCYEAGAFPGSPVSTACQTIFGPYDIEHATVEGYDVVTNVQKSSAYRAPGSPSAAFAAEQVVDELAARLRIDPVDFRLQNASRKGTRQVTGPIFGHIGNVQMLEAVRNHDHYLSPLSGPHRGRGVASGYWFNATGPASAVASVNPDGTVSLIEGSPDIGGSRASMAMHIAEVLNLTPEHINPSVVDTDSIGYSSGAGGSGVTFKMGHACYQAAQDIRQQMCERAAIIWAVDPSDIEYEMAELRHKEDPELKMSFTDLASRLNSTGGPIVGRATVNPGGVGNCFAFHIVDVEVDPDTGKVDILRYTAFQDVGKAVHPSYVEGQMQGGAVQGIGWALNEEYFMDHEGRMLNPNFLDYRLPTSLDLPMIDTVVVEVANPGHPFGVRGVGEAPIIPPLAAIANAIQNATGIRMPSLPISPSKLLKELLSQKTTMS